MQAQTIPVGDDLLLEPIDIHHAAPIFALVDRNREHLGEWLPWVDMRQSVDDFKNYIAGCRQRSETGIEAGFVIVSNGAVAGIIGIYYINSYNRIGSVGYWVGKSFEGKGIVSRACQALLHYGFGEMALNRIEIKCGIGNDRSAAIPERLGFNREGILRQAELVNGQFIDLYLFSLLRSEWEKQFQGTMNL